MSSPLNVKKTAKQDRNADQASIDDTKLGGAPQDNLCVAQPVQVNVSHPGAILAVPVQEETPASEAARSDSGTSIASGDLAPLTDHRTLPDTPSQQSVEEIIEELATSQTKSPVRFLVGPSEVTPKEVCNPLTVEKPILGSADASLSDTTQPQTVQPTAVKNDPNLVELIPADGEYWRDFEAVSVREAALLSLGIEPRDIRDPGDEEGGLSNGLKGREYVRRGAVMRNAIAAKVLAKVVTDDPAYSDYVGLKAFVAWAAGKRWPMPEWMLRINTSLSSESIASPEIVTDVKCDHEAQGGGATISPASPTHTPKVGVNKHVVASAFDGIYWNENQWIENLPNTPKWLESARSVPGKKGKGGGATWDPVGIAIQLHDKQRISVPVLSKAFREKPILQPWLTVWREVKDNFPD